MGLPIPQIILAEEKGKKGSFIVIDGKQRLLAIRQFVSDSNDADFPQLRLTGLSDRSDLNGLTYHQLHETTRLRDDLNNFENQTVRTVVIRGWNDEKYLYSVFLRINTGSVQLSPQELRQALHPGDFSDYIDDLSTQSEPLKRAMKLKEPDFRMRDVELVLRFFAYRNFLVEYSGNLKTFLDNSVKKLNSEWAHKSDILKMQAREFDLALEAVRDIFGEHDELRKWNGKEYEKVINRAVFDIMVFFFSDQKIRDNSLLKKDEIKSSFQNICESSRPFLSAIEVTTKSKEANKVRFSLWADELSRILGYAIESPLR